MTDITSAEQSQWRNLEQSSGKSQAQWLELAAKQNFAKHSELVNWLKSEFGLGHGNANLIAHRAKQVAAGGEPTAEDLLAFDQRLFGEKLLSPQSTKQLLTFHPDLGYSAYGLWGSDGWGTFAEKFYYRTGGILGSTSNWIHTLGSKKTILILSNTNHTNLFGLSEELYLLGTKEKTLHNSGSIK